MTTTTQPTDIVRDFYDRLAAGDAAGALGLMAPDIEWTTMWHYKVEGRGPAAVAEGLFKPLAAEWTSFSLVPTEFVADGETVLSLGDFHGVHGNTGKVAEARYAHVCGTCATAGSCGFANTSTRWRSRRHACDEPRHRSRGGETELP